MGTFQKYKIKFLYSTTFHVVLFTNFFRRSSSVIDKRSGSGRFFGGGGGGGISLGDDGCDRGSDFKKVLKNINIFSN